MPTANPKTIRKIVLCTAKPYGDTEAYLDNSNRWTTDVKHAKSFQSVDEAKSAITSKHTQYICDYEIYGKKVEIRGTWYA